MKENQKDPSQEFDSLVCALNKWLKDYENPMKWVMRIVASCTHPLWRRNDLTMQQIDAVSYASDWERVAGALESIVEGRESVADFSVEEARQGLIMAKNMYDMYQQTYIAQVEMRTNSNYK